jgi:hypothetical protein
LAPFRKIEARLETDVTMDLADVCMAFLFPPFVCWRFVIDPASYEECISICYAYAHVKLARPCSPDSEESCSVNRHARLTRDRRPILTRLGHAQSRVVAGLFGSNRWSIFDADMVAILVNRKCLLTFTVPKSLLEQGFAYFLEVSLAREVLYSSLGLPALKNGALCCSFTPSMMHIPTGSTPNSQCSCERTVTDIPTTVELITLDEWPLNGNPWLPGVQGRGMFRPW